MTSPVEPFDSVEDKAGAFLIIESSSQSEVILEILITHIEINYLKFIKIVRNALSMLSEKTVITEGIEEIDCFEPYQAISETLPNLHVTVTIDNCNATANELTIEPSVLLEVEVVKSIVFKISNMKLNSFMLYSVYGINKQSKNWTGLIYGKVSRLNLLIIENSIIRNLSADCIEKIKLIDSQCILSTVTLFSHDPKESGVHIGRREDKLEKQVGSAMTIPRLNSNFIYELVYNGYKFISRYSEKSNLEFQEIVTTLSSYCVLTSLELTEGSSVTLLNYFLNIMVPLTPDKLIFSYYYKVTGTFYYIKPPFYVPFTVDTPPTAN